MHKKPNMKEKSNISSTDVRRIRFSALNPYVVRPIPEPTESAGSRGGMVSWGDGNSYPMYLLELRENVTTLQNVINGSADYVCGDGVKCNVPGFESGVMNRHGDTIRSIVRSIAMNYFTCGGFPIQIIRSLDRGIGEIYSLEFETVRSDAEGERFYYSEKFGKGLGTGTAVVYPRFVPHFTDADAAILYRKNTVRRAYPQPIYSGSIKACEIERKIDDYHLNGLENAFMGSHIISLKGGFQTDEQQEEIEKNINEKFGGTQNAGRIMVAFTDSTDDAVKVEKLEQDDLGERYTSAASRSRQQIYAAFRANPNLFGIPTESLGFSSEEYEQAFKLFNRTQVQPVQQMICETFDYIFGMEGSISIQPFTLEGPQKIVE